jgi:hypothetical protein
MKGSTAHSATPLSKTQESGSGRLLEFRILAESDELEYLVRIYKMSTRLSLWMTSS